MAHCPDPFSDRVNLIRIVLFNQSILLAPAGKMFIKGREDASPFSEFFT